MPIPSTKLFLQSLGNGGYAFTPSNPGEFSAFAAGLAYSLNLAWLPDLNGDGIAELVVAAPGQENGNKAANADSGRIYIDLGSATGGGSLKLGDQATEWTISGKRGGDLAGAAMTTIASLNGDALPDLVVGTPGFDGPAGADTGGASVLWGSAAPFATTLGTLGTAGYSINGAAAGDRAGATLAAVADLNGDGRAEILLGAPGNDLGGAEAGAAYLLYGKATTSTVNLANLGAGGFRIRGEAAGDGLGAAVGTVADLNGDGRAELLLGAAGNDAGGTDAGAAYVVFGKTGSVEVNLATLGAGGFRIRGVAGEGLGSTLTGLGDVNGDGTADLLLGTANGGKAYVVFGKATTSEVNLATLGSGGYTTTPRPPATWRAWW